MYIGRASRTCLLIGDVMDQEITKSQPDCLTTSNFLVVPIQSARISEKKPNSKETNEI